MSRAVEGQGATDARGSGVGVHSVEPQCTDRGQRRGTTVIGDGGVDCQQSGGVAVVEDECSAGGGGLQCAVARGASDGQSIAVGGDHDAVGGEHSTGGLDDRSAERVALQERVHRGGGSAEGDVAQTDCGVEAGIIGGVIGQHAAVGVVGSVTGVGGDRSVGGASGVDRPIEATDCRPSAENPTGIGSVVEVIGISDVGGAEVNHPDSWGDGVGSQSGSTRGLSHLA